MKDPIPKIDEYFRDLGWKKGRPPVTSNCNAAYYSRFSGYPECGCNPGKGILVYADVWDFTTAPFAATTIELHLVGQIRDEQWVDLHVYGIDNLDHIPVCCERLLKAWKTMNEITGVPE